MVKVDQPRNKEEWKNLIRDIDIIAGPLRQENLFNESLLKYANNLKMIQTFSIGYDYIETSYCAKKGILVCNVPEVSAEAVAQHIWALILSLSKKINKADKFMREQGWAEARDLIGTSIWGKKLGVIGLGSIGGRVALKGKLAFGLDVIAFDPFIHDARAQLYGSRLVDLDVLLSESDIICISVPLTESTKNMINGEKISKLKERAFIINISRKVIDDNALIKHLNSGRVGGAGLDAFSTEPLGIDNPLLKMDNVVLTPEIASATKETIEKTYECGVDNVVRYINGKKPYWIVN
jgi:lactate dehydrogenase-like 2-hydroxyacid dehydrogenase